MAQIRRGERVPSDRGLERPSQTGGSLCAQIGLRYIAFACKPLPIGFLRAAKRLGLPKSCCAVIGDQAFTDILGARLCGIPCIQVLPIRLEEHKPLMRLKRRLERGILARYRRKREKDGSAE